MKEYRIFWTLCIETEEFRHLSQWNSEIKPDTKQNIHTHTHQTDTEIYEWRVRVNEKWMNRFASKIPFWIVDFSKFNHSKIFPPAAGIHYFWHAIPEYENIPESWREREKTNGHQSQFSKFKATIYIKHLRIPNRNWDERHKNGIQMKNKNINHGTVKQSKYFWETTTKNLL